MNLYVKNETLYLHLLFHYRVNPACCCPHWIGGWSGTSSKFRPLAVSGQRDNSQKYPALSTVYYNFVKSGKQNANVSRSIKQATNEAFETFCGMSRPFFLVIYLFFASGSNDPI